MPIARRYRSGLLVASVTAALLLPGAAVTAQDASPSAEPSEEPMPASTPFVPPPGAEELAAMIPTEIGGDEVTMPPMFAGLDFMGSDDAAIFEEIIVAQGKTAEDFSLTSTMSHSWDAGGSVEFAGLRIADADGAAFAEALIPLFEERTFQRPLDIETVELAEKSVILMSDEEDGSALGYLYPGGDTVWFILGEEASVITLLEALP